MKVVCSSQFLLAVTVFIVSWKIHLGVLRQKLFLEKRFQLCGATFIAANVFSDAAFFERAGLYKLWSATERATHI